MTVPERHAASMIPLAANLTQRRAAQTSGRCVWIWGGGRCLPSDSWTKANLKHFSSGPGPMTRRAPFLDTRPDAMRAQAARSPLDRGGLMYAKAGEIAPCVAAGGRLR